MTDLVFTNPAILPSGEIVAQRVSPEEYLEHYAATHHEWVEGVVIRMSPASKTHNLIISFLHDVLRAYLNLNPIGEVMIINFVMQIGNSFRESDLMVIQNENTGQFTDTAMIGAADICIEVVSPESVARDYGDKFREYEAAGVREYWIIDPLRQQALFYRLQGSGHYELFLPDSNGNYQPQTLPKLSLHIPTLWQDPLPDIFQVTALVKAMLEG